MTGSLRALAAFAALVHAVPGFGAATWGGTLDATSDYLVRGITRSDDQPSIQGDLHYLHSSGVVAGVSAATVRFQPRAAGEVELSGFFGYAWRAADDWQGKLVASHYAYPWHDGRADYDYDELTADVAYRGWLDVSVAYSPNYRRFVAYRGLIGTSEVAADLNVEIPLRWHIALIGGVGYSYFGGPSGEGYVYGSAGVGANWSRLTVTVSYVDTSYDAKSLFYNAASGSRWVGTAVFRFR